MSDPNSAHQIWSKWTFTVREAGRHARKRDVELNFARWIKLLFRAPGRARVRPTVSGWRIEALLEGVPAHDPGVLTHVRAQFARFVQGGWGPMADGDVLCNVLAGDLQDGTPRPQMIDAVLLIEEGES